MKARILFAVLGLSALCYANEKYDGWCSVGGQKVITQGSRSTGSVMASYPQCTVTVYMTGTTTPAVLYNDNVGDSLTNPFTANVDGSFGFYAINGRYDVVMSGSGFPVPVTISDVLLCDPASGCGGGGGGGNPAPPLNAVQFNNPLGTFAGSALFTFDPTTTTLNVGGTPTNQISIITPSLTSSYTQSLTATNDPFAYVHGTITPGHLATFYSDTEVQDGGSPGSSYTLPALTATVLGGVKGTGTSTGCPSGQLATGFASDGALQCATPPTGIGTLITPPTLTTGQAYTVLNPTTLVNSYTGGNGSTSCNSTGSGWIDRIWASGVSDWDVYCAWGGYSLPAGVSPSDVVGVYGVTVAGANQQGAPIEAAFGQGTITYNATILFSGSAWGVSGGIGTGQTTTTLATGGSATTFNYGATQCAVDNAASIGGTMDSQTFVNACSLVVVYTGTQTYQPAAVEVDYPLNYNQALGTLGIAIPLPKSIGGTGTSTPALVAGSGIGISGTWPNQTVTNTGTGGGIITGLSGLTAGQAYYGGASGLALAKADNAATLPALCVATSTTTCLMNGVYTTTGLTAGQTYYISSSSAGGMTTTSPTIPNFSQSFGVAISTTQLVVMPSLNFF